MQDYKTMISMCAEQEEKFQFEHFSREDALKIGLKLHENAMEQPVAVEITVNGLVVFRYFAEGAKPDSELWLARKRNAGDLMETSSLRFFAEREDAGETFADRKLDPNEYAAGGGEETDCELHDFLVNNVRTNLSILKYASCVSGLSFFPEKGIDPLKGPETPDVAGV